MTTKPKAQKFRVRRSPRAVQMQAADLVPDAAEIPQSAAPGSAAQKPTGAFEKAHANGSLFAPEADDDGFAAMGMTGASNRATSDVQEMQTPQESTPAPRKRASRGAISRALSGETALNEPPEAQEAIDVEIDSIRREGLTGRQLRTARRVAQQHSIAATSDFDAIRLLRKKGIDPFQKSTLLNMPVPTEPAKNLPAEAQNTLPQEAKAPPEPSPAIMERVHREREISQIQQDIARRRRRKTALLLSRIVVFVGIPTLLTGFYFYAIATPMYATTSSFIVQQAEAASATPSLLSGTALGSSPDAISVQDYLEGRDAMLRLDADVGFKSHFASDAIDAIQRLPDSPTNEKAYKVYSKRVSIGYDPTEGLLRMEVVAADPEVSHRFSEALISYAEEHVDQQTQRLRGDQMQGARDSLEDAEDNMRSAQENVINLQEQLGIISPEAETSALMSQISTFETQLQQKQLQLQQLLDNRRPNQARVEGTQGDIRRLDGVVTDLRAQMTENQGNSGSLARVNAELRMAEVDLQTRQLMMQQAMQALEASRIEANRQTRYLSLSSSPVAPDEPTYPRKFENTVLAFLLFSGIYLLASLTGAVLREQVSA